MMLTDLPTEVLLHVCGDVGVDDLANVMRVSRLFRGLVQGNSVLYKHHYLKEWGDPFKAAVQSSEPQWESETKEICTMKQALASVASGACADDRSFVTKTIDAFRRSSSEREGLSLSSSEGTSSAKDRSSDLLSLNTSRLTSFLARSGIYARAMGNAQRSHFDIEKGRLSAQIHCLHGLPQIEVESQKINIYPYAASKVYDMRNYRENDNGWGPFMDDKSWNVDWEKVEAIMLVLGHNIRRLDPAHTSCIDELWDDVLTEGTYPRSARRYRILGSPRTGFRMHMPARPKGPVTRNAASRMNTRLDELDPYGITGTYLRVVCFLDYRDLWEYNWGIRRPSSPDKPMRLINENEAIRLIVMSLVVTRIEWPDGEDHSDMMAPLEDSDVTGSSPGATKDFDATSELGSSQATEVRTDMHKSNATAAVMARRQKLKGLDRAYMPIVHFAGTSRAMHASWDPNANSKIKGTVRMTPEGELRWTTVSIFGNDEERWKSEGVQVGGLQSSRGIIGNWFDRNYDDHGPAGPTAFWKIRNEVPSTLDEHGNIRLPDSLERPNTDFMVDDDDDDEEDDDGGSDDDDDDDDDDDEVVDGESAEEDDDDNGNGYVYVIRVSDTDDVEEDEGDDENEAAGEESETNEAVVDDDEPIAGAVLEIAE